MKRTLTALILALTLALPNAVFAAEEEDTVPRIEFLSELMKTAGIDGRLYEDSFDDVSHNDPYSDIVGGAVEAKVIDAGGDFRPNDPINFGEAWAMADRALNYMLLSPGEDRYHMDIDNVIITTPDRLIARWELEHIFRILDSGYYWNAFETGDEKLDEMLNYLKTPFFFKKLNYNFNEELTNAINYVKRTIFSDKDMSYVEMAENYLDSGLKKLRQRNSKDEVNRGREEIGLAYGAFEYHRDSIMPGVPLYDDNGGLVQAHGGGMLWDEKTQKYYWYGEARETSHIPEHLQKYADWGWRIGVACYSSSDLYNWTYEGLALELLLNDDRSLEFPQSDIAIGAVIERPKVLYNEKTGKYVMWMHIDSGDYGYARAGVAVSDSPVGPFEYVNSFRPNGKMSRDMTVFADEDGSAYLYSSSDWNVTMYCTRLTDDWLGVTEEQTKMFENMSREAPAVFRYKDKYYIITSGCTGWDPNEASYAVADGPMGPWTVMGNPCVGEGADLTFGGQSCWVQPIDPEKGEFIFMADIWRPSHHSESGFIWLPIQIFNDGAIRIEWRDEWKLEELGDGMKYSSAYYINAPSQLPAVVKLIINGGEYYTGITWDYSELTVGRGSVSAKSHIDTSTEDVDDTIAADVYYIPENTVYFADCGANNDSAYLIAEKLALNLGNSVPDQEYGPDPVTGRSWGYSSKGYCGGRDDTDMFRSVRYSDTPAGYTGPDAGLTYSFEVEPNEVYSVYVGICDPWNNGGRSMDISINGQTVKTGLAAPDTEAVIARSGFTAPGGTLTVTARRAEGAVDDSQDPLLSWIVVEKGMPAFETRQILPEKTNVTVAEPEEAAEKAPVYHSISAAGTDRALNYTAKGVMSLELYNGGAEQQWTFTPYVDGSYVIAARTEARLSDGKTETRCIDVLNSSTEPGTDLITYRIYGTANQRWIPEKRADGTYMLKSASSGLYLTEINGKFSQEIAGHVGNQLWEIQAE